jgi:hypothetical protein
MSAASGTTPQDLAILRSAAGSLHAQCLSEGAFDVEFHHLDEAESALQHVQAALRQESRTVVEQAVRLAWRIVLQMRLIVDEWSARFGLPQPLIVLFSTVGLVAFLLIMAGIVVAPMAWSVLFAVVAGATWFGLAMLALDRLAPGECREQLRARAAVDREYRMRITELRSELENASARVKQVQTLGDLRRRYDEAALRLAQLEAGETGPRSDLLKVRWWELRGVRFEEFVRDVLVARGFAVELVRRTDSREIHLIASRGDQRFALQALGQTGSVGNDAVQQTYTGMAVFRCNLCAIITSGQFTRQARETAAHVGCLLVDGSQIPSLIRGELW